MHSTKHFTVETLSTGDRNSVGRNTSVEAAGPLDAARLVFGTTVAASGKPAELCGVVWELQDNLQPSRTEVFRPNGIILPPVRKRKRSATIGVKRTKDETMALLKIIAICALVAAISGFIVLRFVVDG